ncbi:MAG TPA: ATP-binding protein, partial [Acidobacteriota bacterium]|nr:ATP-binding protein [Acidobacteriota bacterium]
QDLERLYTFSRAILLIDNSEPFASQLVRKLADVFQLNAAALFDRRTGHIHRGGASALPDIDDLLRATALRGTSSSDRNSGCLLMAVRLGSEPIASLAIQGAPMPDSMLQGIANLVAIGLEREKSQALAQQIEAVRRSEQLRTGILDAMAHEFKTPLTSIKAATTALLAGMERRPDNSTELLRIADEGADRLQEIIDDTLVMARLDSAHIEISPETSDIREIVSQAIHSARAELEGRALEVIHAEGIPPTALDPRLIRLALKQLIDNAIKYSPANSPIEIRTCRDGDTIAVDITDYGEGIPETEQDRIFERFFRSPAVLHQIPGSGLGLSIAHGILRAHRGDLTVQSSPGRTTFRLSLPIKSEEGPA